MDNSYTALVEAGKIQDSIADDLIEKIYAGELAEGSILPTERELCELYSVSRTAVREALLQLKMRGYLDDTLGRRPRIRKLSLQSILLTAGMSLRDIMGDKESTAHLEQTRLFIEVGATREAVKRANNVHLIRLKQALEDNLAAIGTEQFAHTDIAFHRVIVEVIENPIILKLHDLFVSTLIEDRAVLDDQEEHDTTVYNEHLGIFQAIINGDTITASDVMEKHLMRAYRNRVIADSSVLFDRKKP